MIQELMDDSGSGNGLVSSAKKVLPKPMLTKTYVSRPQLINPTRIWLDDQ